MMAAGEKGAERRLYTHLILTLRSCQQDGVEFDAISAQKLIRHLDFVDCKIHEIALVNSNN